MDKTLEFTQGLHQAAESVHVPSMLLDVQNGKPFEVEAIVGEVVRMAREREVDVPVRSIWFCLSVEGTLIYSLAADRDVVFASSGHSEPDVTAV